MFSHRKQACEDTCTKNHKHSSANSALWAHSRDAHDGGLTVEDWRVTILSSHRGALNRQVTEAVSISKEGVVNLLISNSEFGANNITEITVKKGNVTMGVQKRKRKDDEEEKAPQLQEQQHQQQQAPQHQGQQRIVKTVVKSTVKRILPKEEPLEEDKARDELILKTEEELQANDKKQRVEEEVEATVTLASHLSLIHI